MSLDEADNHSELIAIQTAGDMKAALRGAASLSTYWVACPQKYDTLKTVVMHVLILFQSTHTYEVVTKGTRTAGA